MAKARPMRSRLVALRQDLERTARANVTRRRSVPTASTRHPIAAPAGRARRRPSCQAQSRQSQPSSRRSPRRHQSLRTGQHRDAIAQPHILSNIDSAVRSQRPQRRRNIRRRLLRAPIGAVRMVDHNHTAAEQAARANFHAMHAPHMDVFGKCNVIANDQLRLMRFTRIRGNCVQPNVIARMKVATQAHVAQPQQPRSVTAIESSGAEFRADSRIARSSKKYDRHALQCEKEPIFRNHRSQAAHGSESYTSRRAHPAMQPVRASNHSCHTQPSSPQLQPSSPVRGSCTFLKVSACSGSFSSPSSIPPLFRCPSPVLRTS